MITLETQGLVDPNRQVPIDINQLLDVWRQRRDPLGVAMVQMLEQLQIAISTVWTLLQSPDEIVADSLQLTNPSNQLATTLSDASLTIVQPTGTKSISVQPGSMVIADSFSGANGSINLSITHDSIDFLWVRNAGQAFRVQANSGGVTVELPAGAQIKVGGVKVLTDQQPSIGSTVGTAGATYTATEQALLNSTISITNTVVSTLRSMGIIA